MTVRRRWISGNSRFTDDNGIVREWDAKTFEFIRTLPTPETHAPSTERQSP